MNGILLRIRNAGDRRARGVICEPADHRGLAVADENLRRRLPLADDRRVELHVVGRVVVRLAHGGVHVAIGIDDRRDRERRADGLILNRLHEPRSRRSPPTAETCTNGTFWPTFRIACLLFCAMITGSVSTFTSPRDCSALIDEPRTS